MARKNLHLYPSDFTHESRMLKETKSVIDAGLFDQIIVGATRTADELLVTQRIDDQRRVRRFRTRLTSSSSARLARVLSHLEWTMRIIGYFSWRRKIDAVTCHGLTVLPIGVFFKFVRRSTLIYSPHELETETANPPIPRKIAKVLERRLIGFSDSVIVVGDHIADWYRDAYGLEQIYVARNIPSSVVPLEQESTALKDELGIPADQLLFLYQGGLFHGRGIELLLDVFEDMPEDRHLVFLGYGGLEEVVRAAASERPNVHYHPAVAPDRLALFTASADVGLALIENTSLSYYYSLGNKVFEYILGGVPVVVSDFPEMAKVIDESGCGWKTAVEVEAVRSLLLSLTATEVSERRAKTPEARVSFNWETEQQEVIAAYVDALS